MKKHHLSHWSQALLISASLLGSIGIINVATNAFSSNIVRAASGTIIYHDDATDSNFGRSMFVSSSTHYTEDIPDGYTLVGGQSGITSAGNQFDVDTSVITGPNYIVHFASTNPNAQPIESASGLIVARDSNNVNISKSQINIIGSSILSTDVPEGFVDAGNQDAGISIANGKIYVNTKIAANPYGLSVYYVKLKSADGITVPRASALVSTIDAESNKVLDQISISTAGS